MNDERQARIEAHRRRIQAELEHEPEREDRYAGIRRCRKPFKRRESVVKQIRRLNMMARNPGWSVSK